MDTASEASPELPSDSLSGPDVRLKRHPERGSHERAAVYAIIDEALIGHVAFTVDGRALSLPTAHARVGDVLYLHGARANRSLRALCDAPSASVTFTLLDGLVLARTAFHHSLNYRSAVVFGPAREVVTLAEKRAALHALVEHIAPGRMRELGEPTQAELTQTLVLCLTIEEASAKQRAGDPRDAESDLTLPVWAGTVPLALTAGEPRADRALRPEQALSEAAAARAVPRPAEVAADSFGEYELSTDPARLQLDYIHAYLSEQSYWAKGVTREAVRASLRNSVCFGAYDGARQIGFARVLSDHSRFAYLADVFIDESLRGRGLGRALVEFALNHPSVRNAARCLLGTRDAHTLYERYGFERAEDGRYMLRLTAG